MVKLKRIITFTKGSRKKLKIKTMRIKFKNINHQFRLKDEIKTNRTFTKWSKEKKIEIKRIMIKLENIFFDKLGLKDKIKNK